MPLMLIAQLDLDRCPHCGVDRPTLNQLGNCQTKSVDGTVQRTWGTYGCKRCGGAVVASAKQINQEVLEVFPKSPEVHNSVPAKAKSYLTQAINSKSAPAGAVMLTASSVDAMLKAHNYNKGSLYSRIEEAVENHLLTPEMAKWAHKIRLDANDQRHADEDATLPDTNDAEKAIDFALALAEYLFVLPAKIKRGIDPDL